MDELGKIARVVSREAEGCDLETLLVVDATTGQNGVNQARLFQEAAGITGIVLTKLDGTAKGGVVIAIKDSLQIPIKFIGVGEGLEDLRPFVPEEFVQALFAGDEEKRKKDGTDCGHPQQGKAAGVRADSGAPGDPRPLRGGGLPGA